MLVLSRKVSEAVVFIDRESMTLIGVVGHIEARGREGRSRFGFNFPDNYLIQRQENTSLAGLSFQELQKVPFGTKVTLQS
jgi:sRNA-binding carbon storage regulator CsrA